MRKHAVLPLLLKKKERKKPTSQELGMIRGWAGVKKITNDAAATAAAAVKVWSR